MRLLRDQELPRSAVTLLRDAGIDTIHVGEIGYSTADDTSILQRGREEGRVVVRLDADFLALLALSEATSPSVIRIRTEGQYGHKAVSVIQAAHGVEKTCSTGQW